MRLTVLGCSGSGPGPFSPASGYLITAGDATLVLDLGNGTFGPLQRHADPWQLDAVLFSHLHPDHCADLNPLLRARAMADEPTATPLPIYAPPDALDVVLALDRPGMLDEAYELITRGLNEMARLAMRMGGNPLTLAGLAGLGDLVLTCTGELSRNRTVGYEMGRGRSLESIVAGLGHVAEGVATARSAHALSKKLVVEMPITSAVYSVLYEAKPVLSAVEELMARELGYEFDPRAIARATL